MSVGFQFFKLIPKDILVNKVIPFLNCYTPLEESTTSSLEQFRKIIIDLNNSFPSWWCHPAVQPSKQCQLFRSQEEKVMWDRGKNKICSHAFQELVELRNYYAHHGTSVHERGILLKHIEKSIQPSEIMMWWILIYEIKITELSKMDFKTWELCFTSLDLKFEKWNIINNLPS